MSKLYLYERQTEYWTSRGIEDYFLDAGFDVITVPISQIDEKVFPFDFIFFENTTKKLFGIQYKALQHNARDFWRLNQEQHEKLQKYREWGYYCLSEMTSIKDHRIAVHKSIFLPVAIDYSNQIYPGEVDSLYYRWGGFMKGLERCSVGKKVNTVGEFKQIIDLNEQRKELIKNLIDIFVANLDKKNLIHLSICCQTQNEVINEQFFD